MPSKRPLRLDDLFELKAVGRVALATDGRRVAFELKRFDLAENRNLTQLMLVDAESGEVRPLTQGDHNDTLPRWSPDGTRLAFLSDREKPNCLWVLPMTGGDPSRVTDRDGSVSDFAWSADSRRLAYAYRALSEREKLERDDKQDELKKQPQFKHITRLRHKLDGAGWWNGAYQHIWIVPADGGKPRQLSRGDFDDIEPRFSPNGRWVSFISNRVADPDANLENSDIFVVKPSGGPIRQVTRMQGGCAAHSWSPDGKTIAYVGNPAKVGEGWKHNEHVWLVSAAGGAPRELTREIDNHCMNVTLGDVTGAGFQPLAPIWSPDGGRVYFAVSERGATRLYSRSLARRDTRCEVGGEINLMYADRTAADGPIALAIGTNTNPGDIYLFDPQRGAESPPRKLTDVNGKALARVEVAAPRPVSIKSGPVTLNAWELRPPDFSAQRKYPAILQIHGGPTAQYGASFFHEMQWMAAKGYVVVFGNPRGSSGYGLKFQSSIHAAWGTHDYDDVMKIADWLFARPYVDRARVGITGGSYGGYMTNFVVGHSQRFKAAVTQRSVVNLESMFGTSDYGAHMRYEFGGFPWIERSGYLKQSPLTYAKNIRTPLLIEHEEQDHRCPIEQAEQLFTTLKALGREVELVRFEGESHGLSRGGRPQNRAERLRRIVGWFDKHLGK